MSFAATTTGRANTPRARTLLDIFNAIVARCDGRDAIDADDATLTYRELSDAAGELAERLWSAGIGPGDRVGVRVASGTSELYAAILGVLRAGAAYVPVDADDPPARAADVLERSSTTPAGCKRQCTGQTAGRDAGSPRLPVAHGHIGWICWRATAFPT
jgi:non-ribosomal peptide synthetase component F